MTIHQTFAGKTCKILTLLGVTSFVFFKCLSGIRFQRNGSKFHVLLSLDKLIQVNTNTIQTENNRCEQLLSVAVDAKLSFEKQNYLFHKSKDKTKGFLIL